MKCIIIAINYDLHFHATVELDHVVENWAIAEEVRSSISEEYGDTPIDELIVIYPNLQRRGYNFQKDK